MFETLVIGVLPGRSLGLVRQCIECRAAAGPQASPCPGFGPGCLATPNRVLAAWWSSPRTLQEEDVR